MNTIDQRFFVIFLVGSLLWFGCQQAKEGERVLQEFEKIHLSSTFYAEGAGVGDLNGDGHPDVICGPYWYVGPEFGQRHEFYEPVEQDRLAYSKNFFVATEDMNGNGRQDILNIGFPGEEAYWYENPGDTEQHWARHLIHPQVDNESPWLVDLDEDGQLELVAQTDGYLGIAKRDSDDPYAPWHFIPVSEQWEWDKFTHGLGVGDLNGDGLNDILKKEGWWENPGEDSPDDLWTYHQADLGVDDGGGAQMHVVDVDADGLNDVITSLNAHGWGLVWYRQVRTGDNISFEQQPIMGATPQENPYGVAFSEIHAIDAVDMNGDGVQDIVTGKRWWAHGPQEGDHDPHGAAVLYWFELDRSGENPRFIPHLVDYNSGVGVDITAEDLTGNGYPDLVSCNKQGASVFLNRPRTVSRQVWEFQQPTSIN